MSHLLLKSGVVGLFAFGFILAQSQAQAFSSLSLEPDSILITIADQETEALESDMDTGDQPMESEGTAEEGMATEGEKAEDAGDMENEAVEEDLETGQ